MNKKGRKPKKEVTKRYEDEELGSGTFGQVSVVKVNGKLYALKTIEPNRVSWVEVDIMNNYKHPNIMSSVHPKGSDIDGILMEIGNEINIRDQTQFIDFMKQTTQGLQFLNSRGVLHLDIKLANLVEVNGTYKFIDFGLSLIVTPEMVKEGFEVPTLKYSKYYDSPEAGIMMGLDDPHARWKSFVSEKTEIFALALTWLSVIHGSVTPSDREIVQITKQHGGGFERIAKAWNIVSYLYHERHLKDPEDRKKFVIQRTKKINLDERYVDLICDMLEWDPIKRLNADQVLERLNVGPVPGTFSVFLPALHEFDVDFSIEYFAKYYGELDVMDLFRYMDLYSRHGGESLGGKLCLFLACSYSTSENEDHGFTVGETEYPEPHWENSYHEKLRKLAQTLDYSIGSCNLLYRAANSIDALVWLLNFFEPNSVIDFYKLKKEVEQKFEPGSKKISCSDFAKRIGLENVL
jgi:serine/threonine protein kinase